MTQPAGWFPDPELPGQQRYWDGAQWTSHRAPVPAPAPAPTPVLQVSGAPAPMAIPMGNLPGDKSPGLAGFLSFLISGVGQMYTGYVGRGFAWMGGLFAGWVFTFILSFVLIGLLFIPVMFGAYIWCIVDAASCANRRNYELRAGPPMALATAYPAAAPALPPGPGAPGQPL